MYTGDSVAVGVDVRAARRISLWSHVETYYP